MIVEYLLSTILNILQVLLGVLPDLPDMPTAITDGTSWVLTQIASVISVIEMYLSRPLLLASITVGVGILIFEYGYSFVMFILRKIPVINIK